MIYLVYRNKHTGHVHVKEFHSRGALASFIEENKGKIYIRLKVRGTPIK